MADLDNANMVKGFVKKPEPNRIYRHYKGGQYKVLFIANHSETDEDLIVYQSLHYGSYHARPIGMWFDEIISKEDSKTGEPVTRFELCDEMPSDDADHDFVMLPSGYVIDLKRVHKISPLLAESYTASKTDPPINSGCYFELFMWDDKSHRITFKYSEYTEDRDTLHTKLFNLRDALLTRINGGKQVKPLVAMIDLKKKK